MHKKKRVVAVFYKDLRVLIRTINYFHKRKILLLIRPFKIRPCRAIPRVTKGMICMIEGKHAKFITAGTLKEHVMKHLSIGMNITCW